MITTRVEELGFWAEQRVHVIYRNEGVNDDQPIQASRDRGHYLPRH